MPYTPRSSNSPLALISILAGHAGLVWLLAQGSVIALRDASTSGLFFVELAPKPTPSVVEAANEAQVMRRRQPVSIPALPRVEAEIGSSVPPAANEAPPSFELSVDSAAWGKATGAGATPRPAVPRAPDDYADRVKARVNARVRRPADAVYAASRGVVVQRECTIPYEIVVGREGQVIEFRIEACGDAALDEAAREALRGSGPHPTPPGHAASHLVYGSINLKANQQ